MALQHVNLTVGTTATLLMTLATGHPYTSVLVGNNDNSPIYIGDSAITSTAGSSQGLQVNKGTVQEVWMHAGDSIYAISALGTTAGAVTIMWSNN